MINSKIKFLIPIFILLLLTSVTSCTVPVSETSTASETTKPEETDKTITPNIEETEEIESTEAEELQETVTEQAEESEEEPSYQDAICIRVIDGDTIEIKDEAGKIFKVRYIGIDTPEKGDPYYKEATDANSSLVLNKQLRLEKDVSETDKYGRLLRYIYAGDLFVNAYLVEEGYAQVSTYPPDVKYANYFLELQQEARENGKGLWGIETAEQEEQEQSQEQQTEQAQEQQQTYGIEVVSLTSPISRGAQASITIKTAPNVLCTITVYYKSGPSKAKGLDPKNSDANGNCAWSWKVGTRTTPGNWKIVITAEGIGQIETYFTVTK